MCYSLLLDNYYKPPGSTEAYQHFTPSVSIPGQVIWFFELFKQAKFIVGREPKTISASFYMLTYKSYTRYGSAQEIKREQQPT